MKGWARERKGYRIDEESDGEGRPVERRKRGTSEQIDREGYTRPRFRSFSQNALLLPALLESSQSLLAYLPSFASLPDISTHPRLPETFSCFLAQAQCYCLFQKLRLCGPLQLEPSSSASVPQPSASLFSETSEDYLVSYRLIALTWVWSPSKSVKLKSSQFLVALHKCPVTITVTTALTTARRRKQTTGCRF